MELKEKLISFYQDQTKLNSSSNLYVSNLREAAIEVFKKKGFPTLKEEEWKYTNLNALLQKEYNFSTKNQSVSLENKEIFPYLIKDLESYRLVFVNGFFSSSLSQLANDQEEIELKSLLGLFPSAKHKEILEKYYGKIFPREEPISALNSAFANDGAFIYIPKNKIVEKPIEILYFSTYENLPMVSFPRNLIILEENASAKIIERHISIKENFLFTNSLSEIYLEKGSNLDYTKLQNDLLDSAFIDNTFIDQKSASKASVHTFSMKGKFIRNNLNFYQKGEGIYSYLNGLSLLDKEQLVDHHTLVDHLCPNCESHQLYKSILNEKSKGVFNGKIMVNKVAQKINAFQKSAAILLSSEATINAKPQLEIFADDVKCSHGSTIGQLNQEALFYLRSRGIPKNQARALLLSNFAQELVEKITNQALKNYIYKKIIKKLNVQLDLEF